MYGIRCVIKVGYIEKTQLRKVDLIGGRSQTQEQLTKVYVKALTILHRKELSKHIYIANVLIGLYLPKKDKKKMTMACIHLPKRTITASRNKSHTCPTSQPAPVVYSYS